MNAFTTTGGQVGGFADASATKEGNGMMKLHIYNEAGLGSFTVGLLDNKDSGPFRTIYQAFEWEEPVPAKCQ